MGRNPGRKAVLARLFAFIFGLFPLCFRHEIGDLHDFVERVRGDDLGIVIEVRVNVRRRAHVAVTEPFLDLLHRYAVGEHQRRAGVAQIVKAYRSQPVLLQKPPKRLDGTFWFKEFPISLTKTNTG